MATLSAKEITKKCFNGARYSNTTIAKYGKITKDIAFELCFINNGKYMGEHLLTIANESKCLSDNYMKQISFRNYEDAMAKVEEIRNIEKNKIGAK